MKYYFLSRIPDRFGTIANCYRPYKIFNVPFVFMILLKISLLISRDVEFFVSAYFSPSGKLLDNIFFTVVLLCENQQSELYVQSRRESLGESAR